MQLEGTMVGLQTKRGWLDDAVKISKRRSADVGWKRMKRLRMRTAKNYQANRYFDLDLEEWDNRQQERDHSLTLRPKRNELLDQQIGVISYIE